MLYSEQEIRDALQSQRWTDNDHEKWQSYINQIIRWLEYSKRKSGAPSQTTPQTKTRTAD